MTDKYSVKYLGGMALYHEVCDGVLVIDEKQIVFEGKKFNFAIPFDQIIDVTTSESDDPTKSLGTFLAVGMIGMAAARGMNKIRILKLSYKGEMGTLQNPQFRFIPKNVKQVDFIKQAASRITELKRKQKSKQTVTNSVNKEEMKQPREVVKVEREIIRETIIKIRCQNCRGLYDEMLDKCPHCGSES